MRAKIARLLLILINKFYKVWIKLFMIPYTIHAGNFLVKEKRRFTNEVIALHKHILLKKNVEKDFLGDACL